MFNFNKSSGQASRMLLVLAIVILVAVIIVYLVMRMATPAPKPVSQTTTTVALPVYEQQLGNIDFVFESALDKGTVLRAADITSQNNYSGQKDLVAATGGRFIRVTVGAKNKGTVNTVQGAWAIENIVDSEGRNFIPDDQYLVAPWLPTPNSCGAILKPAFDPAPCTKIYEVSNESTGLKIRVETGKNNAVASSGNLSSFLIDLIVK